MFSQIIQSNFLYHATSKINIPHNLSKIPGLPTFHSIPNVNILPKSADFISAFSSTSLFHNVKTDALNQIKKLQTKIPKTIFSSNFPPKPILHNNFLCKPDSLLLITQQELKVPNVTCTSCEVRSKQCLDCKY